MEIPRSLVKANNHLLREEKNLKAISHVKTMITYPFSCIQAELSRLGAWADAGIIEVIPCLGYNNDHYFEKNRPAEFHFKKIMEKGYHKMVWEKAIEDNPFGGYIYTGCMLFPLKNKTYWKVYFTY